MAVGRSESISVDRDRLIGIGGSGRSFVISSDRRIVIGRSKSGDRGRSIGIRWIGIGGSIAVEDEEDGDDADAKGRPRDRSRPFV